MPRCTNNGGRSGVNTAFEYSRGSDEVHTSSTELFLSPVDSGYHEGPREVVHRGLRRFRVEDLVKCKRLFQRAVR